VSTSKPGVQAACLSLPDHLHKVLSQMVEFLQIVMLLADALNERLLACRELLLVYDEQPGPVPGRQTALGGGSCLSFLTTYPVRWPRQASLPVTRELADQRG
jgi:hypothetical protein